MQDKVIEAARVCAPCAVGDHGKCRVKLYGCACALCAPDRSPYVREIDGEAFLSQVAVQKAIAAATAAERAKWRGELAAALLGETNIRPGHLADRVRAMLDGAPAAPHERWMVHPDLVPALCALGFRVEDGPEGKVFCGTRREWDVALMVAVAHGLLVKAEREACAKVALAFEYHDVTVHDIAAAIRARR